MRAVVAMGSNLGDRAGHMSRALAALSSLGEVVARSALHESAPVGPPQPGYLNAVALVETALSARAFLEGLLGIERSLGRVRDVRWGPRTIDLDLVALGPCVVVEPGLVVPHPEAHRRAFVLLPLAEVAPALELPGRGVVRDLVAALPAADRADVRVSPEAWRPA
jgi:2-amino-4-hydroxy-6-hydroxymethyldihydropteridine diphosphokinase